MFNPNITLETERTLLRNLVEEDAENLFELNLDPEVLKYTGDHPFQSIAEAKLFLEQYDQYSKYGVGRLAVVNKKTDTFIGWCGLKFSPDSNEYDIGFRFSKEYWNKGYATETAKKCLEYGFNELKIEIILGRAMTANKASIKVLENLEMTFKQYFDFDGEEGLIYEVRNKGNYEF